MRRGYGTAVRRGLDLVVGLVLFGAGLWLGLVADLGVAPWEVLTGGLSRQLGTSFGRTSIAVSVVVLLVGLAAGDFHGVESVGPKRGVNTLIPQLKAAGARDILELPISKIVE